MIAQKTTLSTTIDKLLTQNTNEFNIMSNVFALFSEIKECEKSEMLRDELLEILSPLRKIASQSPFIYRMQEWPLGYQGDFEMIEYIMDAKNFAKKGTIPFYLEQYMLNNGASQQHRSKVSHQAGLMLEQISKKDNSRILSIACGSSPDLSSIQHEINKPCEFVLFDLDSNALEFSKKRLSESNLNCKYVKGNVLRLERDLGNSGKFDLVIIGGLFDYLSDKLIVKILTTVWDNYLQPGGKLFFSNLNKSDHVRIMAEYLGNWLMTYRNESDLVDLCIDAKITKTTINHFIDVTGLACMVEAIKPDHSGTERYVMFTTK